MPDQLKRSLSLPLITFYGLGSILGAGIYVLIGEVAAKAGFYTPLAFLVASFIAGFSAFSFAELSSRFPKSAGESLYTQAAFGRRLLSTTVGIMVIAVGIVSAATISRGFIGYLHVFFEFPDWLALSCLIIGLGLVACWGISESVTAISLLTIIELSGLLYVLWIGRDSLASLPARLPDMIPPLEMAGWSSVFSGAFLAFYAFIGFEDMVNVAEEVRKPRWNLPIAIIVCFVISTTLYIAVALVAVLSLPMEILAGSHAPLALLHQFKTGTAPMFITLVSLFAITNGALVQIILGSRVLYGLSDQGWLPPCLGKVNPRTRTPLRATCLITAIILCMALWLPMVTLARITSLITLLIFTCVNTALIVIKRRDSRPEGIFVVPMWVPCVAIFINCLMIILELLRVVSAL